MKRIGLAVICLLLPGCAVRGEAEAGPTGSPSSGSDREAGASMPSPMTSASPAPEPARVRWAEALVSLRRGGPRAYGVLLTDSGATVLDARGRWDPTERTAAFDLLISQPLWPGRRFGGPVVAVGDSRYLRRSDTCWERIGARQLNDRPGITDATLGLTALDVLSRATLKGESLGSQDVLRLELLLADVLGLFGATLARPGLRGTVEGEVEILDGEVTEWSIGGPALAAALPGSVRDKARARLEGLGYAVAYGSESVEAIRRPPADKLAPGPGMACRDGEDREV